MSLRKALHGGPFFCSIFVKMQYNKDMDLSRPSLPARSESATPKSFKPNKEAKRLRDQLVEALGELEEILKEIDRLKYLAQGPEDWRVVMLYIATQKPRVSKLSAFAERVYAEEFGESYDSQFADIGEGSKPPTGRTAEIRAKRAAGLAYETAKRFDRTWKDLEHLLWACKDIALSLDHQQQEAATFEAYPEHMFGQSSSSSSMSLESVLEDDSASDN